jgi:hypothetical protein
MVEALAETNKHLDEFEAFDQALRAHNNAEVESWNEMLTAFYQDSSQPCPFSGDQSGMCSVRHISAY